MCNPVNNRSIKALPAQLDRTRIIKNGADVEQTNTGGKNPLIIASEYKQYEIAAYLLEHGVEANASDTNRDSALHLVFNNSNLEMIQLLISKGANLNLKN